MNCFAMTWYIYAHFGAYHIWQYYTIVFILIFHILPLLLVHTIDWKSLLKVLPQKYEKTKNLLWLHASVSRWGE